MLFFFFNDTATTEIYTLSLHDALPIFNRANARVGFRATQVSAVLERPVDVELPDDEAAAIGVNRGTPAVLLRRQSLYAKDRKSTRLNSSHLVISYAVFCLKKKNHYIIVVPLPPPSSRMMSPIQTITPSSTSLPSGVMRVPLFLLACALLAILASPPFFPLS